MKHPIISKQEFVKYIEHIKDMDRKENVLSTALETIDVDANIIYISLYTQERHDMIELLEKIMDVKKDIDYGSIIEYFIYELEFGTKYKPGCITESDGSDIDLSSAEALYDYCCYQYGDIKE